MLPCRRTAQQRRAGELPMPCMRTSAVREEASDQGAANPGPMALPGQSQDRGRVSSPLSESMLQILPCTVVPPNLNMGGAVGVGGRWTKREHHLFFPRQEEQSTGW